MGWTPVGSRRVRLQRNDPNDCFASNADFSTAARRLPGALRLPGYAGCAKLTSARKEAPLAAPQLARFVPLAWPTDGMRS